MQKRVQFLQFFIKRNKKTVISDGLAELIARFELATSSLPRMRSTD